MINAYRKKEWNEYFHNDELTIEREKGREEGIEPGIREQSYTIAKSLKNSGVDNQFISEHTGLSIDEIEKL